MTNNSDIGDLRSSLIQRRARQVKTAAAGGGITLDALALAVDLTSSARRRLAGGGL